MNTLKQKLNLKLIMLLSLFVLSLIYVPCMNTYAGSINENEATVISVASSTFKYNGKTYRAKSEYISELYNYLADDETDLTAEQASAAIDYIFSNVQDGVESGYLYQVGGESDPDNKQNKNDKNKNNSDKNNSNKQNDSDPNNKNNTNDSNNSDADSDKIYDLDSSENQNPLKPNTADSAEAAQDLSDKEVTDLFKQMEENQKLRNQSGMKASDSDATIIMSDETITITTRDKHVVLYKDLRIVPRSYTILLIVVSGICLIANIIMATILISQGCMRFKKSERSKPRKGHRRRRKIRKVCRNAMTVTSAISITIVCLILAMTVGFFNTGKLFQNIQTSGYFRFAYTEYLSDATENNEAFESYDSFIVKEKVALDKTLAGSGVEEGTEISSRSIAPYIKRVQIDVKTDFVITMILSIVAIIIATICNIFMDLKRDRGVKSIAISVIVSTVVTFASAIILNLLNIESRFFVEPGYLYNFLGDQIDWTIKVFVIIGLFATAIAASLVGLYKTMRTDR